MDVLRLKSILLMILSYHDQTGKAVPSGSQLGIILIRPMFLRYKYNTTETAFKDNFIDRSWIKH